MVRANESKGRWVLTALSPLIWFCVLWIAALWINNPLLLPMPWAVLKRFLTMLLEGNFYKTVSLSLGRILAGLALGVTAGAFLGLASFLWSPIRALIAPLLTVVRSTPVASFVILIWSFTGGRSLPLVIAALMVIPIAADQLLKGLEAADPALGEVVTVFRIPRWRALWVYRLPSALPYFFGSLVTSAGFAWKAGIAAEILAMTKDSIGRYIYESKSYMETVDLWAWTLAVVLLSLIIELAVKKTLRFIEKKAK